MQGITVTASYEKKLIFLALKFISIQIFGYLYPFEKFKVNFLNAMSSWGQEIQADINSSVISTSPHSLELSC